MTEPHRKRVVAAVVTLAVSCMAPSAFGQTTQRLVPPPPVPEIYDPIPGPFFIVIEEGAVLGNDQLGIIDHVIESWRGETLGGFLLCYRGGSAQGDGRAESDALAAVTKALRARGASMVAIHPYRTCPAPASSERLRGHAHVEIMGVLIPRR